MGSNPTRGNMVMVVYFFNQMNLHSEYQKQMDILSANVLHQYLALNRQLDIQNNFKYKNIKQILYRRYFILARISLDHVILDRYF